MKKNTIPQNYDVIAETGKRPIKMWTRGVLVEEVAKKQLLNVASMPFIHSHIAVMPDVHWGKGATVGSVIPTIGAIIPAAVGVDIGCGLHAVKTSLKGCDLPTNLQKIRLEIESRIPHGRTDNGGKYDKGAFREDDLNHDRESAWFGLEPGFKKIISKHPKIARSNSITHISTLGSGNHFAEVCLDEENHVWLMVHSGSRGVGNAIGSYFIELAKNDMRKYFINLPDTDLAYIPEGTEHFDDYIYALEWSQNFARVNRELMIEQMFKALRKTVDVKFTFENDVISCHHNYVSREMHMGKNVLVTRKGAVRAGLGEMGIIPGSMGAKTYIVRGRGNSDSFESCSHGAGRAMSREQAKKTFTLKMHREATEGVECRKDKDVIDETPGAYKPIDDVMNAQRDLVEVVHTLKQVICVKG